VEDQGIRAVSPDYGPYEYQAILRKLESFGFGVISEQRPKNADPTEYAQRVANQLNLLLKAGVPPKNITIVGASKGAAIAMIVSHQSKNKQVNFILLGSCSPDVIEDLKQKQMFLYGNILAIYDSVDEFAGSCEELFSFSKDKGIGRHAEIVLHIGTGHGILYKPLEEWILPTIHWAKQ
jgi:hypothetical protein